MAQFIDPFPAVVPERKLTKRELTRCIRQALASEHEAVHLYESIADATDDPAAKAVLQDIADEERVHAGEFQRLLSLMLDDEDTHLTAGAAEVDELVASLKNNGEPCVKPASEAKSIPVPGKF